MDYMRTAAAKGLTGGQVIWRLDEEKKNDAGKVDIIEVVPDTLIPKLTAIPVAFVGEPGDPPVLMDLAYTNLKYAQKLSDYENIIHLTCVPIKYTTGVDAAEFGNANAISGATIYHLPDPQSKFEFAEVKGNAISSAREALQDLRGDMATLGLAMLASDRKANADITATEKLLDTIKETSTLQVRANQLKDAIELALGFTAEYLSEAEGGSISLGASWSEMALNPQQIQALSALVTEGQLSLESLLWTLEKADLLPEDVTAKDEMERIDAEMKANAAVMPVINARNFPNGVNNADQTTNTQPPPPQPQGTASGTVSNG